MHTCRSRKVELALAFLVLTLGAGLGACGPTLHATYNPLRPTDAVKTLLVAGYIVERPTAERGYMLVLPDDLMVASMNNQAAALVKSLQTHTGLQVLGLTSVPPGLSTFPCDLSYLCPTHPLRWVSWERTPIEARTCELSPATAQALAAAHAADGVLVAYSTWDLQLGFSKDAVANTTFKLYDKDGGLLVEGVFGGTDVAGVFPAGESLVWAYEKAAKATFEAFAARLGGR